MVPTTCYRSGPSFGATVAGSSQHFCEGGYCNGWLVVAAVNMDYLIFTVLVLCAKVNVVVSCASY